MHLYARCHARAFVSRGTNERKAGNVAFALPCDDRSIGAIERKLTKITHQYPLLRSSEGIWDLDTVDIWVDEILGDHELVNQLVRLSSADAEEMLAVCLFLVAWHESGLIFLVQLESTY